MKDGPRQSKTVPTVYSYTGISEMKSHVKKASYTKELDWSYPSLNELQPSKVLHLGHYAINKMNLRARETVYWPGISEDIKVTCHSCDICAKFARTQQKETLQYMETSQARWEQLGLDLFSLKTTHNLLAVDHFSWFPVVRKLQSLHSVSAIKHLKEIFTEIGVPRCIASDGGTQFISQEFKDFTRRLDIQHQNYITHQCTV